MLSSLKQEPLWVPAGFSGGTTALADVWESCRPGDCHQSWPCHRWSQRRRHVCSGVTGRGLCASGIGLECVPSTHLLPRNPAPDRSNCAEERGFRGGAKWVRLGFGVGSMGAVRLSSFSSSGPSPYRGPVQAGRKQHPTWHPEKNRRAGEVSH